MVIEDTSTLITRVGPSPKKGPKSAKLALPLDRFASFVIDHFLILTPLQLLLLSPFERLFKESYFFGDDYTALMSIGSMGILLVIFFVFYHALFLSICGGTPGQLFMGLRVVQVWNNKKMNFPAAAYRSVLWLSSGLVLGIPLLSIFMDPWRRGFYDRVTDSIVITVRPYRQATVPKAHERGLVRAIYSCIGILIVSLILTTFITAVEEYDTQARLIETLEDQDILCGSVTDFSNVTDNRLSAALILYLSEQIDPSCIEAEFDPRIYHDDGGALAYLAKAFVYMDSPDLSHLYLDEICKLDENSAECAMARSFEYLEKENYYGAESSLQNIKTSDPIYAHLWTAKVYVDIGRYEKAQKHINQVPRFEEISYQRTILQAKVFEGMGKHAESLGALSVATSVLGVQDRTDLLAFSCYERLWNSCGSVQSFACESLNMELEKYPELLSSLNVGLAHYRNQECQEKGFSYTSFLSSGISSSLRALVSAVSSKDITQLKKLMRNHELDTQVRLDAAARILDLSRNLNDLDAVVQAWKSGELPDRGDRLGKKIVQTMLDRGENDEAKRLTQFLRVQPKLRMPASVEE